jgi:bifunctional DNase/RNase
LRGQPAVPAPEFRMAIVAEVSVALPSQFPTVVLRETEAPRRQLSFTVGMQDGVGLSHALRRVPTPRPLTHELVTDVLSGFDIDVVAIRMVGRQGQTYFAELDLRGRSGRNVHSCRPTDALAIALRQAVPVPILIDSRLFEESGDVVPWTPPVAQDGGTADVPGEGETTSDVTEGSTASGVTQALAGGAEAPAGEQAEAETDGTVVNEAADKRSVPGSEAADKPSVPGGDAADKRSVPGGNGADGEPDTELIAPVGVRGDTEEIVRP